MHAKVEATMMRWCVLSSARSAALNTATFEMYKEEPTLPDDVHSWGYDLQKDYARAWGELGERYGAAGDVAKEQACYARAARWAPWLVGRE